LAIRTAKGPVEFAIGFAVSQANKRSLWTAKRTQE